MAYKKTTYRCAAEGCKNNIHLGARRTAEFRHWPFSSYCSRHFNVAKQQFGYKKPEIPKGE